MANFPDDGTALSIDDEDDDDPVVEDAKEESPEASDSTVEPSSDDRAHQYGANSRPRMESQRTALTDEEENVARDDSDESNGGSITERIANPSSKSSGFIADGLTKNELVAFIAGFVGSYTLAGLFYWGMLSNGFGNIPAQMWILLGILVLAPLALMFGLQQTSGIASVILNRGSR